jgi:hypothetical protein
LLLVVWFGRLKCPQSQEEELTEAIERAEHKETPLVPEKAYS